MNHLLSTGDPSTIGSYLKLSRAFFGAESSPVTYLLGLSRDSPKGEDEPILVDESQMIFLLGSMLDGPEKKET